MGVTYLIDGDNISLKGIIEDVPSIDSRNAKFIIFYNTDCNEKLSLKDYSRLSDNGHININLVETFGGEPNALDFQLSSYLGYLISEYIRNKDKVEKQEFVIISRDKGFSDLIKFWATFGIRIKVHNRLSYVDDDTNIDDIQISSEEPEIHNVNNETQPEIIVDKKGNDCNNMVVINTLDYSDEMEPFKFKNILNKDKYNPSERGYHSCYLEKELRDFKRISERSPKNKVTEASMLIKRLNSIDLGHIKHNSNQLKKFLILDLGECYNIISYIVYYSPSFTSMKKNLAAWFESVPSKKIGLIADNMAELVNKDVYRFEI